MSDHDSKEQTVQPTQEMQSQEGLQVAERLTDVRIAFDQEVRQASAKVFRLHARLFEALAE